MTRALHFLARLLRRRGDGYMRHRAGCDLCGGG